MTGYKDRAVVLTEISLIMAAVFWGANYAATQFAALCIPPIPIVAVESVLGVLTRHTDALYAYLNREVL